MEKKKSPAKRKGKKQKSNTYFWGNWDSACDAWIRKMVGSQRAYDLNKECFPQVGDRVIVHVNKTDVVIRNLQKPSPELLARTPELKDKWFVKRMDCWWSGLRTTNPPLELLTTPIFEVLAMSTYAALRKKKNPDEEDLEMDDEEDEEITAS